MSLFKDTLQNKLDAYGLTCSDQQIGLCEQYYKLVVAANQYTNLTRITGEAQAADMHFADAAAVLCLYNLAAGSRVIDIGTGAGFPGVPLKIFRPDTGLTLLDASGKKTEFISKAADTLHIDVTVICARAEEAAGTPLRETFDLAVSRAVAPLNMLLELCTPFIKTGGLFAAWKGESYMQELKDAGNALNTLGCTVKGSHPVGRGAILLIEKQKPAQEKYPRRFAKIKSSPL